MDVAILDRDGVPLPLDLLGAEVDAQLLARHGLGERLLHHVVALEAGVLEPLGRVSHDLEHVAAPVLLPVGDAGAGHDLGVLFVARVQRHVGHGQRLGDPLLDGGDRRVVVARDAEARLERVRAGGGRLGRVERGGQVAQRARDPRAELVVGEDDDNGAVAHHAARVGGAVVLRQREDVLGRQLVGRLNAHGVVLLLELLQLLDALLKVSRQGERGGTDRGRGEEPSHTGRRRRPAAPS